MACESVGKLASVFVVINSFGRGGAEMSLAELVKALAKPGRNITYIALWGNVNSYNFDWVAASGVRLIVLNETKKIVSSFIKCFRLIYEDKPNLIYSAGLYPNIFSQICAFLLGITHIASIRTNPLTYYDSWVKRIAFALIISLQRNIVFISQKALNNFLATAYGRFLRRKRFFVLHNPIARQEAIDEAYLEKKFDDLKQRIKKLATESGSHSACRSVVNFVIVSRLVDGKGIMETLEQVRTPFKNKNLHLSIYGAGLLEDQIREYISREFLNKNVVLKGFCADTNRIFADSDIIIFPSRSEGFGRAPFEAFLRGNLVLCNDAVSIINEFLPGAMAWNDYSEPLDLLKSIERFAHIEPKICIDQVKLISAALSPRAHAMEFEKIISVTLMDR